MISECIPYVVAAYLLGSVPFGKLIAKIVARIDITKRGSGNIGATNVAREVGIKWGLLTLALDVIKGSIPVVLFAYHASEAPLSYQIALSAVGLSALLGHQFSIFQGFRGGKGVATGLGIYLAMSPYTRLSCLVAFILFIVTVYKWRFVSLGSMVSACAMPLLLLLFGETPPLVVTSLIVAGLISFAHRENIQRLAKGEENKWKRSKSHSSRPRSLSNSSSE